ncbi:MAG: hypothetical protein AAB425_09970, partial [Bdellovibrionota bacterium]
MQPESPTPSALVFLLPLLIPMLGTARTAARRLGFTDPDDALAVAPTLLVSALLVLVHFTTLLSQNFVFALVSSFLILALPGMKTLLTQKDWKLYLAYFSPLAQHGMLLATLILIAPTALNWSFHDELYITGHWSVAAAIQNGVYPPVNMNLPDLPLQYHYGFALLTAIVSSISGFSLPLSVDLLTLLSWCLTWLLLSRLAPRILPNVPHSWLLPVCVLFGAGLPYFCGDGIQRWLGVCIVDGLLVNPPIISYFFQHPWNLALPIGFLLLLIHLRADDEEAKAAQGSYRIFGIALLLVALSMSQIAFFFAIYAVLLVCEFLAARRSSVLLAVLPFAIAIVFAKLGGGFFASIQTESSSAHQFSFKWGVVAQPHDLLFWHFTAFGLGLPIGLLGISKLRRPARLPVGLLILGGLTVLNFLDHARDDAANKFATIASLGFGLAASAQIASIWSRKWPARVLLSAFIGAGVLFPVVFAWSPPEIPVSIYHKNPTQLDLHDVEMCR